MFSREAAASLSTTQIEAFFQPMKKRKRPMPFHFDPAIERKNERGRRLKRKGLALPANKAALRNLANQASAGRDVVHVPIGARARNHTDD